MHDCYEVLCETKRDILDGMPKDIIHDMSKCVDEIIAAMDQCLLLIDEILRLSLRRGATARTNHLV